MTHPSQPIKPGKYMNTWGQEPWRVAAVTDGALSRRTKDLSIFDADDKLVTVIATVRKTADFSERDVSIAERIVACVNWCRQ